MDTTYLRDILAKLLTTPSITGYTEEAVSLVEGEFKAFGLCTSRTNKGGLIATLPGTNSTQHRTLSAHVDTLGAMVARIKDNGRLQLTNIGGFMWNSVEGEHCQIHTGSGKVYTGTILTTKASTHVYGVDAAKLERKQNTMEVRLDEKVKDKADVEKLGIAVGDFVSFDPRTTITESGFIKSRHLDDKAGVAVLLAAAKHMHDNGIVPTYTTHFFITNFEEIGHGASYGTPPETFEFVAVDMGCIGEGLNGDEFSVSICAKDSSGPYDLALRNKLVKICQDNNIQYKVDVFPYYGSDASAALRAGADIRHGLIGPGVDASHAHERTHMDALVNTLKLVLTYLQTE